MVTKKKKNIFDEILEKQEEKTKQQEVTLPTPEKTEEKKPEVFRNERGNVSGVTLPSGNTYLGLSPDEAEEIIQRETKKSATPGGAAEFSQRINTAQLSQQLEQQKVFEPPIQEQELKTKIDTADESIIPAGNLPIISPSIRSLRNQAVLNSLGDKKIKNMGLEEFRNSPESIEEPMLNKIITNEIDLEVLKSGEAKASQLGILIESIPVVGSLSRKYIGGLIKTPSREVDEIVSQLKDIETDVNQQGGWSKEGSLNPAIAIKNINNYEQQVQILESKIKFLIIQSSELQSSPEEVNKIQQQIRSLYSVISNARSQAAGAYISDVQTDTNKAYITLNSLKSK